MALDSRIEIHEDMLIEELVRVYPASVRVLMQKGIKCIACGEPIWGTLGEAARSKGFSDVEIRKVVQELNDLLRQGGDSVNDRKNAAPPLD